MAIVDLSMSLKIRYKLYNWSEFRFGRKVVTLTKTNNKLLNYIAFFNMYFHKNSNNYVPHFIWFNKQYILNWVRASWRKKIFINYILARIIKMLLSLKIYVSDMQFVIIQWLKLMTASNNFWISDQITNTRHVKSGNYKPNRAYIGKFRVSKLSAFEI